MNGRTSGPQTSSPHPRDGEADRLPSRWPSITAGLLALVGPAVSTAWWLDRGARTSSLEPPVVALFFIPLVAALLLPLKRFEAAVIGRGLLWSVLSWAALASVFGNMRDGRVFWWAMGLGASLLVLSFIPLERYPGGTRYRHAPVRGPLLAVLTMSIADTVALLFWGFVRLDEGDISIPFMVAGGLMAVVVWGLSQLRAWAFFLNVVANIAIAVMAWNLPDLPPGLALALTTTAVFQLLAGLPISIALIRGREFLAAPWAGRATAAMYAVALVGVTAFRTMG